MSKASSTIEIPLRFTASQHLISEFKVNGIQGTFLVDTGASNSCIEKELCNKFQLQVQGETLPMTSAGNEKLSAEACQSIELKYENHLLSHLEFMLIDMRPINTALKEQGEATIDGILGADVLRPQNAIINYKNLNLILTCTP